MNGRHVLLAAATVLAVALLVGALWAWESASELSFQWQPHQPEIATWAVRSASVAAVCLAEVLLLQFVTGALFRARAGDHFLRVGIGALCVLSAAFAVALGIAAR